MSRRASTRVAGPHIAALDGVRGLAILLVLLVHFVGDAVPTSRGERLAVKAANYGVWGVDLFFVLSGRDLGSSPQVPWGPALLPEISYVRRSPPDLFPVILFRFW